MPGHKRFRWGVPAIFLSVSGVVALSGTLLAVTMFAPVTRTGAAPGGAASPGLSAPGPSGTPTSAPQGLVQPSPPGSAPISVPPSPSRAPASRPATPPKASPSPVGTGVSAYEAAVLSLVNQQRAKAGCAALISDARLVRAARGHSADMAAKGYFDHTTPSGVTAAQRITNAGYRWSAMGENIAAGQRTPADVMQAWMNSAGHRANILNCGFRNIGVGLAYDSHHTPFWTQDFATPL